MDALDAVSKATQLGALVLAIANVNLWNRLNIATRQVVGEHQG
jgi:alkylhydroperoxidase family enzyme